MTRRHFLSTLPLLTAASCDRRTSIPPPPSLPPATSLAIPAQGIYTGAFIEFGDREDDVTLEKIEAFETLVGKHQAIVASSSYWGEQTFPERNLGIISRHGAVPLVFWSPWDRPYTEGRGPDAYSLTSILDGKHDSYIDRWADSARALARPIIVSFCNEMNGSWFPWSGIHYGGGKLIPGTNPPLYEGPESFKKAWRYVVDRVRARSVKNIRWVLHMMDFSDPQEEWNLAAEYYPGPGYVDWLGFSLYGAQFPSDDKYPDFFSLFDWPYTELTLLDPDKPIMLCEWGVAELPRKGDKSAWISEAFRVMQTPRFNRLKAAVFWHERWQNSAEPANPDMAENAGKYSDLRVNSSPGSLAAYRAGVSAPFFLSAPQWSPD
jgi:hypothetical protein